MNSGLTLLREKYISGDQALQMFRSYIYEESVMSDFAIATGGWAGSREGINYTDEFWGDWWTQTSDGMNDVITISRNGLFGHSKNVMNRCVGIRPALPLSEILATSSSVVRKEDSIVEVECGWYPQNAAPKHMQETILKLLRKESGVIFGRLDVSGKSYTVDSRKYDEFQSAFAPQKLTEYLYQNRRYVCHKFNSCYEGKPIMLSNRQFYKDGDYVIYEVNPVIWLVDSKAEWCIAKNILVSGVRFNGISNYHGNFRNTTMNRFLQNHMSKDLFRSNTVYAVAKKRMTLTKKKNTNPYNLSFDKVSEEEIIKGCIESGIAPYLHAPIGDGKSGRIHQLDPECEVIYLVSATPESINGKSAYNAQTGEVIDIMPSWLKKINEKCEREPDKIHIVFFDEFTNAPASIQKLVFNIVLDKEVNGKWKLPKNCAIVAAGNETKDSKAAYEIVEPMFDRFAHVYINTTVESWLDWATTPKKNYQKLEYKEEVEFPTIHPLIYSFVSFYGKKALRTPYTGESPNANPRKWELASKLLYGTGKPEMLRALIGTKLTASFCNFCQKSVISLEDVIHSNYDKEDLEMDMAASMAMIASLSSCEEKDVEVVRNFVKSVNLDEELVTTFDSLWSHGDLNRLEKIAELKMAEEVSAGGQVRWVKKKN